MTYERQVQINSVTDGSITTHGYAATVHYTKDSRSLIPDAADFAGIHGARRVAKIAELLARGETVILVPGEEYLDD